MTVTSTPEVQHNNAAIRVWESPVALDNPDTWEGGEDYQSLWILPSGSFVLIDGFGVTRPLSGWDEARSYIAQHGTEEDLLFFTGEAIDLEEAYGLVAESNAWHAEIRQLTGEAA